MVLCVARTFLGALKHHDETACCLTKIRNCRLNGIQYIIMVSFAKKNKLQVARCMMQGIIQAPCIKQHAPCTMRHININDYDYDLPADRIAQYPVKERDKSKLLIFRDGKIREDTFRNIDEYLPPDSLLVFNNTRVIRARLLFHKVTGAVIEILCLEPISPSDYALSLGSKEPVEWKCIIGNLKKWKTGILGCTFEYKSKQYNLFAEKVQQEGDTWKVKFSWDFTEISFGEVIESAGHIPLPPYIDREDEIEDNDRYQTIYSRIKGSVAAPTAGLHFTDYVLEKIKGRGIKSAQLTLHVGAGTFQPVKTDDIYLHEMHCEHFSIDSSTIQLLIENLGKIVPVGTTSVRTLESLYWLGVKLIQNQTVYLPVLSLGQWEANETGSTYSAKESLEAILKFMNKNVSEYLHASTSIMIVPGYKFRITDGIITNFHQPRSTLLLLISAWTGKRWKDIYSFALQNKFRFLSYGDSSLLLK
jgi:S-adenosylmethionine:tRNA ribosyltransferase-isomerase